jgi:hypothetical protein
MIKSNAPEAKTEETAAAKFVLQGFDPVTETVCVEWRVSIDDLDALRKILAPDSDGDPELKMGTYQNLSKRDMRRIGRLCRPPVEPDTIYTAISRPFIFAHVPYMVHTNFELPLMLDGRKPLAVFGSGYPSDWFDDYLAPFEPFVESGQIVRRIVDRPMPHIKERRPDLDGIRDVFFALPGEEWRIDAYIALFENRTGEWNDDLERREGSLLGYDDWQNDWWIEQRVRRRQG